MLRSQADCSPNQIVGAHEDGAFTGIRAAALSGTGLKRSKPMKLSALTCDAPSSSSALTTTDFD